MDALIASMNNIYIYRERDNCFIYNYSPINLWLLEGKNSIKLLFSPSTTV